jgi:hypothetical protein
MQGIGPYGLCHESHKSDESGYLFYFNFFVGENARIFQGIESNFSLFSNRFVNIHFFLSCIHWLARFL